MLYHQSEKAKHSDRVSVLSKIEDKYSWENVNFPTTFDDITTFENNNRVCVNIFGHDEAKTKSTQSGWDPSLLLKTTT